MEALILDTSFVQITLIDAYESFIWTERYIGTGDFELYFPFDLKVFSLLKEGYYVWLKDAQATMIIEEFKIESKFETGVHLTISGRSLESILDRRIVWGNKVTVSGNFQNCIKKLINDNVISPSDSNRKINGFVFKDSTDPVVTGCTLEAQYTGDNLYDVIEKACKAVELGFRVTLNDSNQFVFELYSGEDRTYAQTKNQYVIFSPEFENLMESNFLESPKTLKNAALVLGEEKEDTPRVAVSIGTAKDLDRREMYVNASDIRSEDEDRNPIPSSTYQQLLRQKGNEELTKNTYTKSFEGRVEATKNFVYGVDFGIGDIVQIENEYGIESTVRVLEFVRSQDTNGYSTYPTFGVIDHSNEK